VTADGIEPADREMTARAAEAFALYEGMGPGRSLEKLVESEPALNVTQVKRWSRNYGWQDRLKRIAQANVERANEIRLAVWLRTIGIYDAKTQDDEITKLSLGEVHSIHDRVRPMEVGTIAATGSTIVVVIEQRADGPA
jgi:hypothetical protein